MLQGGYKKIYPLPGVTEKYDRFLEHAPEIFAATAASKVLLFLCTP
jgi:hypothetical protein